METNGCNEKATKIGRFLSFNNFQFIETIGTVGGMFLMWKERMEVVFNWKTDKIICLGIRI